MSELVMPPQWSAAEIEHHRKHSEGLFTQLRKEDGPRSFERMYRDLEPNVRRVFAKTADMTHFSGDLFREDPDAWQIARYLCAPPISQEDLWTIVGGSKFKRVPHALADDTADALRVVFDPVRFPWLAENRQPTVAERESGIMATTVVWAVQRLATERRGTAATQQEALTGLAIKEAGYEYDTRRSRITFLDDMSRGTYSRERVVGGSKCDVPVRLRDGRLLALECKVSNGPKNGWKRVSREVGGKADTWHVKFGEQIITGVVLAGVFDRKCLVDAQAKGVSLFWQHDLNTLTEFIQSAD